MNKYVENFLKLRCSGDILNSIGRFPNVEKEITESMAIIKQLKNIVLAEPNKYSVIDLCAGNALTSVIAVHLLPIIKAVAIDKRKRKGFYDRVERFTYLGDDITRLLIEKPTFPEEFILLSVHPCQTAEVVVDLFNNVPVKALIMMPCCHGLSNDLLAKAWLHRKLSEYDLWTYHLAKRIKDDSGNLAKVKIITDQYCISPRNNIIVAIR